SGVAPSAIRLRVAGWRAPQKAFVLQLLQTPDETDRIWAPPALNGQSILSISLIDDPRTEIERPFSMYPRNSTVLFQRLELFQRRQSPFPCPLVRIPHKFDGI